MTAALAGRRMIVRPGLITGPGDDSDRFGYWPARFALAGEGPVLVPDPIGRRSQVIDARDLADLIVDVGVRALDGVVDAVGESVPLADALDLAAEAAGSTGERVVATDEQLVTADVRHWAGPRSLPLWLPSGAAGMLARSDAGVRALGAARRPLAETMRDVLADERERGIDRPRASGLTRGEELQGPGDAPLTHGLHARAPRTRPETGYAALVWSRVDQRIAARSSAAAAAGSSAE